MAEFRLPSGHIALVDEADLSLLANGGWRIKKGWNTNYIHRHTYRPDGRRTTETLHRVLLGARPGELVDHINHNGLDNRRSNLRIADPKQNAGNYLLPKHNTSGRKGVTWSNSSKRWHAQLRVTPKTIHLGFFVDLDEAADAYDAAAIKHFGEFALTNAMLREGSK